MGNIYPNRPTASTRRTTLKRAMPSSLERRDGKMTANHRFRVWTFGVMMAAISLLLETCGWPRQGVTPSAVSSPPQAYGDLKSLNQIPRPMTLTRRGHNVAIHMYTEETEVSIAPGVHFPAWTFDGTVPGPVIDLRQGDRVTLTVKNLDPRMPHAIDLHAAMVAPNQNFTPVLPGQSKTLYFTANKPGVFLYHCESNPMPMHMAQGMYGAVIVTPLGQKPPLYTLVQSEFYRPDSLESVLNTRPRYVVFNGMANRYQTRRLPVPVGTPFTIAFVNAGPNDFAAFHVVGTVLRDVEASGDPRNNLYDVQTYSVAPGDACLIHLKFQQPGDYAFVSHAMNQFGKGAYGIFAAGTTPFGHLVHS